MCLHTTGSEHCAGLKYLGLNISQSNLKIMIDEVNYIKSIDYIAISNDRKKQEDDLLCKEENDNKYFRRPIRLGLLDKQDQI